MADIADVDKVVSEVIAFIKASAKQDFRDYPNKMDRPVPSLHSHELNCLDVFVDRLYCELTPDEGG
jgi:hypothetical protein